MSGDRLPHACYGMLKGLDDCNRVTWASNIKILLCKFGFEYVWNAQGVQAGITFLCVFEDRVNNILQHYGEMKLSNVTYSMFKTKFVLKPYLDIFKKKKHRNILQVRMF